MFLNRIHELADLEIRSGRRIMPSLLVNLARNYKSERPTRVIYTCIHPVMF